jgi:hypothetical protein
MDFFGLKLVFVFARTYIHRMTVPLESSGNDDCIPSPTNTLAVPIVPSAALVTSSICTCVGFEYRFEASARGLFRTRVFHK